MRVTREVLLGIGIGLISSSLLMLNFSPAQVREMPKQETVSKSLQKPLEDVQSLTPKSPAVAPKVKVIIPKGANSEKIASILVDCQVIQSVEDFSQMARTLRVESKFIAGSYSFSKNEELSDIIRQLVAGPNKE